MSKRKKKDCVIENGLFSFFNRKNKTKNERHPNIPSPSISSSSYNVYTDLEEQKSLDTTIPVLISIPKRKALVIKDWVEGKIHKYPIRNRFHPPKFNAYRELFCDGKPIKKKKKSHKET